MNDFQLTERTQVHMAMFNVQKGDNSKSRWTRVMVHISMLFHSALYMCEVLQKYFRQYQGYGAVMNDGSADGRMDGRTLKISDGIT